MEFGPIFRTLVRNKTRFVLIGLEVALTMAIVVNSVNMILDHRRKMLRPTGIDEEHILRVHSQPFSHDFREDTYRENSLEADLQVLRSLPGVRNAEGISSVPLSGSGSSSGYKPLGSEMNTVGTGVFTGGLDLIETLGVRLIQGRDFLQSDIHEAESKNVILSKPFADHLFPDGDALGKQLQGRTAENPHTIVGIIEHMHGSWPGWDKVHYVTLFPGKPGSYNWGTNYLVRVEPGGKEDLIPLIEERLLAENDGRNVKVETLSEIKAETYQASTAAIKMLTSVIFLLVCVTAIGIIGITSFSVTERTHHIGTRRALGARKVDILRYFLLENWIITTLGLVAGGALSYALNYLLVTYVDGVKLDWRLVVGGVLLLWLIGILAALTPALRGARISPAMATRTA